MPTMGISQQIQQDIHIMAAFGQGERAAGLLVVPGPADIAVSKMVVTDIFIVLNRYHRAKPVTFQYSPDLSEEQGVPQHMAYRNHLIRERLRKFSNLL